MCKQNQHNKQNNKNRRNKKFCGFCKKIGKNPIGHNSKSCPEILNIKCPHCGKQGHTIRYCPFIEKCKFCKRVGHLAENCYYDPRNQITKCNVCKKYGHKDEECYYASQEQKDQIQKRKQEEKKRQEEREERSREFASKGYKYTKDTLTFYKTMIESGSIPWEVYDSDDEVKSLTGGLTKREKERLEDIKYEIKKLFG